MRSTSGQRTLSSPQTVVWKLIFPAIWILGFGAATVALWLSAFRGNENHPPPDWVRWQVLAMWLLGSAHLIWFAIRLHRVSLDKGILTASNFFHEVSVPVTAICRVTQSYMSRPTTITIHLDRPTSLGSRIFFLPEGPFHFLSSHPITDELNAIIARTHGVRKDSETFGTPWASNPDYTFNDKSQDV